MAFALWMSLQVSQQWMVEVLFSGIGWGGGGVVLEKRPLSAAVWPLTLGTLPGEGFSEGQHLNQEQSFRE